MDHAEKGLGQRIDVSSHQEEDVVVDDEEDVDVVDGRRLVDEKDVDQKRRRKRKRRTWVENEVRGRDQKGNGHQGNHHLGHHRLHHHGKREVQNPKRNKGSWTSSRYGDEHC